MDILLQKSPIKSGCTINISGSKSESNRLLMLQGLWPQLSIENLSNADDTQLLKEALSSNSSLIDIHHAGTAMRFLTAYLAIQEGRTVELTGSARMQERPIKVLVDALNHLGADVTYLKNEGYPPLQIKGKKLLESEVIIKADVSSQYITALLLIGGQLENGLSLHLDGQITSLPYLEMTLSLLRELGIGVEFKDQTINVFKAHNENIKPQTLVVESDWSSASYFYSIIAQSEIGTTLSLSAFKADSLQGDSKLRSIYQEFGVETVFNEHTITLKKIDQNLNPKSFDLIETPDLAQTIAVTCLGLHIDCHLTGLHTLKIKETDRLLALKTEMEKLGADVAVTEDALTLSSYASLQPNIAIDTYQDHRMAMAFAPLALHVPIQINNAMVVTKSYPDFWRDLRYLGFEFEEI